jgi:hypothetical protein
VKTVDPIAEWISVIGEAGPGKNIGLTGMVFLVLFGRVFFSTLWG